MLNVKYCLETKYVFRWRSQWLHDSFVRKQIICSCIKISTWCDKTGKMSNYSFVKEERNVSKGPHNQRTTLKTSHHSKTQLWTFILIYCIGRQWFNFGTKNGKFTIGKLKSYLWVDCGHFFSSSLRSSDKQW